MVKKTNIETIIDKGEILAIVAKTKCMENTSFFSPAGFFLQTSIQNRDTGERIAPHEHPTYFENEIKSQEIVYVIQGQVEIGLYHKGKRVQSRILDPGDLILLNSGHNVNYLEDSKILLIKTGPYRGRGKDKKGV